MKLPMNHGLRYRNHYLLLILAIAFLLGVGGTRAAHAQSSGPCDILASSSPATPCVAAFSTVRRLSASYSGPLYQVTRTSDGTTANIGILYDGYADAAYQDWFCQNSPCTITEIYDQSGNGNNLTPAPPGGADKGPGPNNYDLPASATLLPVIAGGHKVYGILVAPGVGYRNDDATGTARYTDENGEPEGVYMVTSGLSNILHGTNSCCFDFGNAETTNDDDGAGHMDAINIMWCVNSSACTSTVSLDLEQGLSWGDVTTNADNQFVTAAAWNDGVTGGSFETYAGNAQSGTLANGGVQSLANPSYPGYSPMHQEGGIVLGIGGDNSNWATGEFFEGVMTTGAPTTSTLNSVQSNIVSVGYRNPPVHLTSGQTYTFQNKASWMLLDDNCGDCTTTSAIVQNSADGSTTQEWTLTAQSNGAFTMTPSGENGYCMDDPWGNGQPSYTYPQTNSNSQNLGSTVLWWIPCNSELPQNWQFIPQSDSSFVIENQGSTYDNPYTACCSTPLVNDPMVIDVLWGDATADMKMWLNTANGLQPQAWVATNVSGDPSGTIADGAIYTFENSNSPNLMMDNYCDGCANPFPSAGPPTSGTQVVQYQVNGWPTQQWQLHSQGNGWFTITSVQSGLDAQNDGGTQALCLDDPWGHGTPNNSYPQTQANGSTVLWQIPCNGSTAQNWKFLPQNDSQKNPQSLGYYVIENELATENNPNQTPMVIDNQGSTQNDGQLYLNTYSEGSPGQLWIMDIQQ